MVGQSAAATKALLDVLPVNVWSYFNDALKLLQHGVAWGRYHKTVGVDAFVIYCRPGTMQQFLSDAEVVAAITRGELLLVLWESEYTMQLKEIAPYFDSHAIYTDQTQILSHAALAYHNANAYLIIADIGQSPRFCDSLLGAAGRMDMVGVQGSPMGKLCRDVLYTLHPVALVEDRLWGVADEFLVSFTQFGAGGLAQVIDEAMQGQNAVLLGRLNILCRSCYGSKDNATDNPSELPLWLERGSGTNGSHPLHQYSLMHKDHRQNVKEEKGKCIIDPSLVTAWSVHLGYGKKAFAFETGVNHTMEPMPRLAFVHARQLFLDRYHWRPWQQEWQERTDWQWALQSL